jgi:uncharacterized protein (TIGR03435 family)
MRVIPAVILMSFAAFGESHPEFEVASIKPAPSLTGQPEVNIGLHIDGAQVNITSLALKDYLRIAYQVKDYQVTGPEWIAQERYSIAAKLPAGASRSQIPDMLKTLLTERFQIKMHHESKEFPVYALIVAKSGAKMKEAPQDSGDADSGPSAATPAVNVNVSGGPGGVRIDRGRGSYFAFGDNQLEGKKLTMPDFADTLGRFTDRPVVDMTELKGAYDFVVKLTPEDYRAMLIRSALAAGVVLPPEALRLLEFSSGDSLFAALQTLGLKLDSRKAPLDVLVVDHAEKTPAEN